MILVTVIVCLSVNTVTYAHMMEEEGFDFPHEIAGFLHDQTAGHCPSCPTDNHPSTDHEHFSCDHHTSIAFATQTAYRHPASIAYSLFNLEGFKFIPEVFLAIDTPPHNLA